MRVTAHIAFRVPDFEVSKRWFIEKLDFRMVVEWPFADMKLAYLAPPNDNAAIIEIIGDANPIPNPAANAKDLAESLRYAGVHHYNFYVDSVDRTIAELRRRGVTIVGDTFELNDISRRLSFFADPFGNLFELAEII